MVSEKLKAKNEGRVGMHFTWIGRKNFSKCSIPNNLDGSDGNFIWYNDDDCVKSAAANDDDNDDDSNGE
jgi:hypothetical protein